MKAQFKIQDPQQMKVTLTAEMTIYEMREVYNAVARDRLVPSRFAALLRRIISNADQTFDVAINVGDEQM